MSAPSRWDPDLDEVKDVRPYDYAAAKRAIARGSRDQASAAQWRADTAKAYAEAEKAYRTELAKKILELKSQGVAVTACGDIARGDEHVANLKFKRDVQEGIREAAEGLQWQASANRRSLEQLVEWSRRVAPDGQFEGAA